jgi:hypothetical protein
MGDQFSFLEMRNVDSMQTSLAFFRGRVLEFPMRERGLQNEIGYRADGGINNPWVSSLSPTRSQTADGRRSCNA